jgi:ATP-dependent helicase IRC3
MAATAIRLRPYQQRAVDAVFRVWDAGQDRLMISAATGAGKSVIFGHIARRHLEHHRAAGPVVLLAHRRELVTQAAGHFQRANKDLRVETVIGSPGKIGSQKRFARTYAWRHADVLVTTPQTLASANTRREFPDPSLVIADEAHHYASDSFKRVMTGLGCFSGAARALGVTATPFREDHRKLSDIFPVLAASIDISWLISHRTDPETGAEVECAPGQGYLVPPVLRHLLVDGLDLSDVPTSRMSGAVDFRDGELAEAMEAAGAFEIVAKTVVSELSDRKGVLFAPTVASSKHLAEIMSDLGAPCGHVDGSMDTRSRDQVISDFRSDKIRWLSNVGIVSEGFDIPEIDTVVLARPTQSRIFFRQAVGRALRPAPGKDHAIVLDVAGASDGHSLAGVEALTDDDVLAARDGESLTELLDRSNRARQSVVDQITAHRGALEDRQERGERAHEQIRITVETWRDKLPGLVAFTEKAEPMLTALLDTTTEGVDLAVTGRADGTMDELRAIEQTVADLGAAAGKKLSHLEALKTALREALISLKEEPQGEVARAMLTGHVGTVRGNLFGEEAERYAPKAPGEVQALKPRGAKKGPRASFDSRYGWALVSPGGHLFVPIHGPGGARAEIVELSVAVKLDEDRYVPVRWELAGQQRVSEIDIEQFGTPTLALERAYKVTAGDAAEESHAPNLINPQSPWRKKAASEAAMNFAWRVAGRYLRDNGGMPEDPSAGYVADLITYGQHAHGVERLAAYVTQQLAHLTGK